MTDDGTSGSASAAGNMPGGIPAGIAADMAAQGGRVTFARFMELALTHPSDGYYSQTETLLGPRGHFSTAPRLSPAFDQAVGRLLEELVDGALEVAAGSGRGVDGVPAGAPDAAGTSDVTLIELGAGEGDLAKAVLEGWQARRPDLRERMTYTIVEIGEHLRARQRQVLAELIDHGWRVAWVGAVDQALAQARAAVVVGNEFVDALPVHLVDVQGAETLEAWVKIDPVDVAAGGAPREVWAQPSPEAQAELQAVFGTTEAGLLRALSRDGIVELRPSAGDLFRELAAGPPAVCLLTIDYGEWFAGPGADRSVCGSTSGAMPGPGLSCYSAPAPLYGRSLRGYFRHQLVTDPYARVGRQDLTADVDFRALDLHGRRAGFETVLFTTVADLLRADRGEERLEALRREAGRSLPSMSEAGRPSPAAPGDGDPLEADRHATILEGLLDAQGLGGAFKVMLQVRG